MLNPGWRFAIVLHGPRAAGEAGELPDRDRRGSGRCRGGGWPGRRSGTGNSVVPQGRRRSSGTAGRPPSCGRSIPCGRRRSRRHCTARLGRETGCGECRRACAGGVDGSPRRWTVEAQGRRVRKPPGSCPWQEGAGPRVLVQAWWMATRISLKAFWGRSGIRSGYREWRRHAAMTRKDGLGRGGWWSGRTPATAFRMGWERSSRIVMEPLRHRTQRSGERQNSMRSEGSSTMFPRSWTAACERST